MNQESIPSHVTLFTCTVLVVDGRRPALTGIVGLLGDGGCRVLTATNSAGVFDWLDREHVDLVLIDQDVFVTNGGELLRRVRAQDGELAIITRRGACDLQERRRLTRELDLHMIHEADGDPARVLELVDWALLGLRRGARTRAAQDLRAFIVAKLCHELLTALHVIRGYTEILRSEPVITATEEILARLEAASDTALDLAHDYLNLARLDSPGVPLRRERVDIDALLEELQAFVGRQIGEQPLRFTAHVPVSGAWIYTDGEKLRAILLQLIANAVKFSPMGEIRLAVRLGRQRTEFVLTDTGPGIREDELARVFSPFRQLGAGALSSTPGQGVGLAIALRLSVLIGASLTVASADPSGAVFTLSVPKASDWAPEVQPILH
jgi:signal transduction histidine kinase